MTSRTPVALSPLVMINHAKFHACTPNSFGVVNAGKPADMITLNIVDKYQIKNYILNYNSSLASG